MNRSTAEVESYPTFWEAVPVTVPAVAPVAREPETDAYVLFADAEDRGPVTLRVEQTDVG